MPLPEKALISGNRACRSGSKLEASKTWNCSISPSAFGKEITVECFEAWFSITENNSCRKGSVFKLNNLYAKGNDNLATALSVIILLRLSLFADQNLSVYAFTDME